MMETIRILLADDHSVVREGLRGLLEQQGDMEVVAEASDGPTTLQLVPLKCPDVIVLDMKMPGAGATETISAVKRIRDCTQILVFTSYAEDSQVRDALSAGATGYLLKDALREDLVRAVREVSAGRAWLHPHAQRQMLEWIRRRPSPIDRLTVRERSVLSLLAEGQSNRQIARNLALTEGTIKGYVSQVLDKLGVADRTQAALLAHREGLGSDRA